MRSRRQLEQIQAELEAMHRQLARSQAGEESHVSGETPQTTEASNWATVPRTQARYQAELDDLAARLEAIERSASFRIGHRIVRTVKSPLSVIRRRVPGKVSGSNAQPTSTLTLPIPPGRELVGPLIERPSTTMFLLWGCSKEALESLVGETRRLQLMLRDFKPLFVTDCTDWGAFLQHGYWFEYIPSYDEWSRHSNPAEWPDYVAERVGSIVATYAPDRTVTYDMGSHAEALRSGVLNRVVSARAAVVEKPQVLPERLIPG